MLQTAVYPLLCALFLPINLGCSFWLFRELLNLSGVTFREVQDHVGRRAHSVGRRQRQKNRRLLMTYLLERSPAPEQTEWLFRRYLCSTLPGALAAVLSGFVARSPIQDQPPIALTGMAVLLACNTALVLWGKRYRRSHPMDPQRAKALAQKRAAMDRWNPVTYLLIGAVALAVFSGAVLMSAADPAQPAPDFYSFHTALRERGYETANIPTTYWYFREDALTNVTAGVQGDTLVEFYEYTNDDAAREVFESILGELMLGKPTQLQLDGTLLRWEDGGITTYLLQKENTVLYAHTGTAANPLEELLQATGYLP